jgi:hypothetical protein
VPKLALVFSSVPFSSSNARYTFFSGESSSALYPPVADPNGVSQ